jgi:hypothetical protein
LKALVVAMLVTLALTSAAPARADDGALLPFVAEYDVRYGSMGVGSSRTELRRLPGNGRWQFESLSEARGLARLIASSAISQRSTFELEDSRLRPLSYRFDDGTRRTDRDVSLEFDWRAGRVRGTAEDEPVDLPADPGLQDAASIQAYVLLRLRTGTEPGLIAMIEKDRVKEYRYTRLPGERLKTALGTLDTVVFRSARDGSTRETIFWFAPALGYAMVQAEQRRDGKRAFQTYIRRYQDGA